MFAWPWVKTVLLKPLIDRLGSVIGAGLVGYGMTEPDATKITLAFIAGVLWLLDVGILHIEKWQKGRK